MEECMKERWKTLEEFEAYEVSDLGNVRRRLPGHGNAKVGKIRKLSVSHDGYLRVTLGSGKTVATRTVHRLVAKAFVPNPKGLPEVNHKREKTDNRAISLEWISMEDHGIDRAKRAQKGDGVYFHKRLKKWQTAYNPEPGKTVHIGTFDTYEEAKAARDTKVKNL
jgi:hypothetical protein